MFECSALESMSLLVEVVIVVSVVQAVVIWFIQKVVLIVSVVEIEVALDVVIATVVEQMTLLM